jgi:hypothetical protein
LGVSGFVGYRLIRQRRILSRQHAHMIGERFHLESDPLIQREKGAIYAEMRAIICSAQSDLETLVTQLQAVLARFRQEQDRLGRRLQELTLPGPSRSAVDVGIAEHFFEAAVPDIEQLVGSLAQSDSLVADWLVRCIETPDSFRSWFYDHVGQFGARCLEQTVGEFSVVDALTSNGTRLESVVERLFERAYPLWNYDPRFLRRAKTQRMTFIGANTQESSWPMLSELVGDAQPEAIVHHTDDPSALIVMAIHRGVPLFALRRIGQYRTHYAEALWRGKLPIHTTNNLALATDLVPMRRRPRVIPATLFSTGLALNVIHRDPDGRYVAPRGQGKTIRLSANKERSVALMGMDGPTCRQVQRRLDALVAQQGKAAIGARLEQYTTDASDLADWEIKGIVEFGRSYERENGNLTSEKASRSQPSKATKSLERAP